MKKKALLIFALPFLLFSCGENNVSSSFDSGTSSNQEEKISFEKSRYEISSKEKVTIKENIEGVTYFFQGGTPAGVSLDPNSGEITFDEYGSLIPEKVYVAKKWESSASTIVSFKMKEEKPNIEFVDSSIYVVDGEALLAKAITSGGREYAVTYSLVKEISGISIDASTGKISFSSSLEDGTEFEIKATSKGESKTKKFIAMTKNIIVSKEKEFIEEKGDLVNAKFTLDFSSNPIESTLDESSLSLSSEDSISYSFSYDKESKVITIDKSCFSSLDIGLHTLILHTPRNKVYLNLVVASEIIYEAKEFESIFEPNYENEIPSFKEGSLSGYYVLGADIDLSEELKEGGTLYHNGSLFLPIGAYEDGTYDIPFTGTFDGNGYTISSFDYKGDKTPVNALFGNNKGTIKNLTLKGNLSNIKSWSGGVVGNNSGTIEGVICDLSLLNEGQSATGVIASVNHGLIKDCFSISEKVKGFNEAGQNFQNAGLLVGLNDVDGIVKNSYAVGESEYKLMGFSLNEEVNEENCRLRFDSLSSLKEHDFSSLNSTYIETSIGEAPKTKTLFVSSNLGIFSFSSSLPSYLLKGNSLDLKVSIKPIEKEEELQSQILYSFEGENYGLTLNNNHVDSSQFNGSEEDITVKATLNIEEKTYVDYYSFKVYGSLNKVEITNQEEYIEAGSIIELKATSSPEVSENIAWTLDKEELGWKFCYVLLEGNKLLVKDDAPSSIERIGVKASIMGVSSETRYFALKTLSTFIGNNLIHYKDDNSSFDYKLNEEEIKEVRANNEKLDADSYSFANNVLSIKESALNLTLGVRKELVIVTKEKIYRAFATKLDEEKATLESLRNIYGDNLKVINSMDDFNSYFAYDGQAHSDKASYLAKNNVYALNTDLDFNGIDFKPIGKGVNGSDAEFAGKLFGLGHHVKNVAVSEEQMYVGGFFFQIEGTIQDLNFENVNINVTTRGNIIGAVAGILGGEAIAKNINVYSSSLSIGDSIVGNTGGLALGGLFGRGYAPSGEYTSYCTYNGYSINLTGN